MPLPVAGGGRRAGIAVIAGGAGRGEGAVGVAAAPRLAVGGAEVAVLVQVEEAVAADLGAPADQGELVGLYAAVGQTGALDLEEVRPARAPGHALEGPRVPDRTRRRGYRARQEGEEGAVVAIEGDVERSRHAEAGVSREIDHAGRRAVRNDRLDA